MAHQAFSHLQTIQKAASSKTRIKTTDTSHTGGTQLRHNGLYPARRQKRGLAPLTWAASQTTRAAQATDPAGNPCYATTCQNAELRAGRGGGHAGRPCWRGGDDNNSRSRWARSPRAPPPPLPQASRYGRAHRACVPQPARLCDVTSRSTSLPPPACASAAARCRCRPWASGRLPRRAPTRASPTSLPVGVCGRGGWWGRPPALTVVLPVELANYERNVNRAIHKYNAYRYCPLLPRRCPRLGAPPSAARRRWPSLFRRKAASVISRYPSKIRSGAEAKKLVGAGARAAGGGSVGPLGVGRGAVPGLSGSGARLTPPTSVARAGRCGVAAAGLRSWNRRLPRSLCLWQVSLCSVPAALNSGNLSSNNQSFVQRYCFGGAFSVVLELQGSRCLCCTLEFLCSLVVWYFIMVSVAS